MLTRTLIFVPEGNSAKNLRGIVSLSGDGLIDCHVKLFNIAIENLPLSLGVKIGGKSVCFNDISDFSDYKCQVVGDIRDDIVVVVAQNNRNAINVLAVAHTSDATIGDYNSLFLQNDNEVTGSSDDVIGPDDTKADKNGEVSSQGLFAGLFGDIVGVQSQQKSEIQATVDAHTHTQQEDAIPVDDKNTDAPSGDDKDLAREAELFDEDDDGIPLNIGEGRFFTLIEPQLSELFQRFPHFEQLEKNVANTEWIKVTYSDNGESHYILGKLYENGIVKYICYGIPADSRSTAPPNSLVEYCQWLPLRLDDIDGAGYWVMYQRADTGENVML